MANERFISQEDFKCIKYIVKEAIRVEVDGLTLNGAPMLIGKTYPLENGDIIDGLDYEEVSDG